MDTTINQQGSGAGHHKLPHVFIVNGRPRETFKDELTYDEVVRMAFGEPEPDVVYTVAYANPHGHDGTLAEGQSVKVKNGMVFNVTRTNRS
jgi:hypothetical protein